MNFLLYPLSANPLHKTHLDIANHAENKYNGTVHFELCRNVYDKEELEEKELDKRINQFKVIGRNWLKSNNTSFLQKAVEDYSEFLDFVPESKFFVCGRDTILRIDSVNKYFGSESEKVRCLNIIKEFGWRFIVYPRNGLDEGLSAQIKEMCLFQDDFEESSISSTQLRGEKQKEISLGNLKYGECFIYNGNKYKLVDNSNFENFRMNLVTVFNGQEFIPMNFKNTRIIPVKEDFYPFIDREGK